MMPPKLARTSPRLMRRRFVMALPLLGLSAWVPAARAAAPLHREVRTLMGTRVEVAVCGGDAASAGQATSMAFAEMQRLAALMSRYERDSVVSRIGQAAGMQPVVVPAEVMAVLESAQRMSLSSEGAFDVTVGALKDWEFGPGMHTVPPAATIAAQLRCVNAHDLILDRKAGTAFLRKKGMAIDLGGIAKLPILDAGLRVLRRHGIDDAIVNGGGDVLVSGHRDGQPWRIGLRDPGAPSRLIGVVPVSGRAVVASSGDYERFFMYAGERQHHILDPATGRPARAAHGVSLVARDVAEVNGLGAAVMVRGLPGGRELLARSPEVRALVVDREFRSWSNPGMAAILQS